MSEPSESALGGVSSLIVVLVALVLCAALVGFVWLRINVRHSLDRADGFELTQRLKRWVEAGKPEGEKLAEFMQGRRADVVATNRVFSIGGTNFVTQFAATKPKSGRAGTLFVTTNEVLIWLDSSGRTELFSIGPPQKP
jgi:hypothetical protein